MPADPVHDLCLKPLGDGAWRLCDNSVAEDDAESLLAYVERRGNVYEATWVRGGGGSARFGSEEELLRAAARHLAACASRRHKPLPIAHRPPLAAI